MLDSFYILIKNRIFGVKIWTSFNGRHNVNQKSVNHKWFIVFFAQR